MNHLNCRVSILLLAPALLLGACGSSGESPQGTAAVQEGSAAAEVAAPAPAGVAASAPAAVPEAAPPAAALREFRDPVTGQPREPTAAELKALAAAAQNTSKAGTGAAPKDKEIVFPNGTVAVEEGPLSEMKGCVQKDGTVTAGHDCKSDVPARVTKP